MNSLAFKAFHYQVTVNIIKRTELHKPLSAKLFMTGCYVLGVRYILALTFIGVLIFVL